MVYGENKHISQRQYEKLKVNKEEAELAIFISYLKHVNHKHHYDQ